MAEMSNFRLIARLDIKGPNVIKGIHLEGLRVVGNPNELALKYYNQGADELIFMDSVASLYGRNQMNEIIRRASDNIFIPITVGGGIRSVENATKILRSGADKIAINTAAVENPDLISKIADKVGNQCIVLSVEAKKIRDDSWEVYTNNGREPTGIDVLEWALKGVSKGAGEILLTSIDKEGTRKGFDVALVKALSRAVPVPVIASGGMGEKEHILPVVFEGGADAIAMADILHYNRIKFKNLRDFAKEQGIGVRTYA